MLTALFATSLLAAAPATGLTVSAQVGKSSTPAATYLDALEQEFIAARLPVRRFELTCDGKRECLVDAARAADLPAIVAVTLAAGKKQTTIDLEALRVRDGSTVGQLTFVVTGRMGEPERAQVRAFATQLYEALAAPEPKPDTPLANEPALLTPSNPVDPLALTTPPPPPSTRSRVPAYLMGGGAVAGAVTSGVFLGLASASRETLESTPNPSPLTRAEADGLAAAANRDYSVSLAAGIVAGALATGAIIWLLTE